jgi:hypothetical protein
MVAGGVPILVAMGSWIRLIAIAASAIVLLGFGLFALDEMNRGSQNQQHSLDSALGGEARQPAVIVPTSKEELQREKRNGDVRELIDDANDILLAPFANLVDSSNVWVRNGVPALLGLLLYGFLLGVVANMLPKQREHGGDWRTA